MRKLYALLTWLFISLVSTSVNAQIQTADQANFTFSVNATTNNVVFTNTSVIGAAPGTRKAFWSFGDGTSQWTPPLQGTEHHYQIAGSYEVCLKIYRYGSNLNDSVLSAHICKTVLIQTSCSANFEIPNATPNVLGRYFIAQPWHNQNKKPVRICWNFGDGTDTCIQYPANYSGTYGTYHLYSQPGTYNVCVNILYDGGCQAQLCKTIIVANPDNCRADFERLAVSTIASPLNATFKALPWHSQNNKPTKICWQFGDGRDTCINYTNSYTGLYTVNHHYSNTGNYNVCVRITYAGGCEATKCKPIQIGRPDTCHADFEKLPVTSANDSLLSYFKALPQHNNNRKPSKICWTFGDNRDTCINYPENYDGLYIARHRYEHPGVYQVCVKIFYYGGCEATNCKPIQIGRPDSCKADFERISLTGTTPLSIGFKALPWHNNNRKPARVCWRFGDGSDTCITYPENYTGTYIVQHRYNQPGQYEVCVKINYYGGCEATKCRAITIPPVQQTCSVHLFEISTSITGLVRGFYASPSSNPVKRVERICWNFGDGTDTCITINPANTTPLSNFIISHRYPGPGVYRACVKVFFEGGCVAYDCIEVVIRSLPNTCGGYMIDSLAGPRTFTFKGFSIHSPNDEAISYRWTFGDGSSAVGREVTHTYNVGGNYEVCLYIKTRLGCETRICKTIRVPGNNQPTIVLTPNPVATNVTAVFHSTQTEPVTIKILNNTGTVVRSYIRNAVLGANTWTFDLSNLVAGVYTFTVQSPHQFASTIFIKL